MTSTDRRWFIAWTATVDTQLLVGLVLYLFLSPMVPHSMADFAGSMKSPLLRFFAVEHVTAAFLGIAVLHGGSVWARRAKDRRAWHGRTALISAIAWVLLVVAVPWPGLAYGRPLFRLP